MLNQRAKPGDPVVQSDPTLVEIGKKYGKLPGQVIYVVYHHRSLSLQNYHLNKKSNFQNNVSS